MKYIFSSFVCALLFSACTKKKPTIGIVDAYAPIYASVAVSETIAQMPPQPIVEGGKIAKLGRYIFQVENNKGIHITDLNNPSLPVRKGFISIPMCQELTLKGNFLYTNNLSDLVVINLTDVNAITVSSRIKNAFPEISLPSPSQTNIYFECADLSKGAVIGWELKKIDNPTCKK
jgi:hypothetical protein